MSGLRLNVLGALCVSVLLVGATPLVGPPDSPVADAAMRGDADAVRTLLQQGGDVNAAQGDGMTALHWAAEHGDAAMAEMLIYAGANVQPVTRIGHYTPLHLATRRGSAPVVGRLLEAGADPSLATTNSGATPLHLAAASGQMDVVTILLDHGADPNAREAQWGQTPLIFAAALNRAAVVSVLVEGGADPDLASIATDLQTRSALSNAAQQRQREVLDAFTSEGEREPNSRELAAAVLAGRAVYLSGEVPETRARGGREGGQGRGGGRGGDDREPQRPSITRLGGLTPLHHAARQGYMEAAIALLDAGADVDRISDGDHSSPLLIATLNGQFDLALLLTERGADPNLIADINGVAPLWAAVNSRWQPRTRFPQPQERGEQNATYLDVMRALLEAGADVDARTTMHPWYMLYGGCGNRNCGLADTEGSTAFWRAAYATDLDAMRVLVAYGADPDIPTKAPAPRRRRPSQEDFERERNREVLTSDSAFAELTDSARVELLFAVRTELGETGATDFPDFVLTEDFSDQVRGDLITRLEQADEERENQPDPSGLARVEPGGPGVFPIHAASGVGYGEGFAGNAHRHAPDAWLAGVIYLVDELGVDVNQRDHNAYNAVHHAAARGDNELILYLVERGADLMAVSRRGQTTVDMANSPVSRISPIPETVALLEALGAKNNHNCVSC